MVLGSLKRKAKRRFKTFQTERAQTRAAEALIKKKTRAIFFKAKEEESLKLSKRLGQESARKKLNKFSKRKVFFKGVGAVAKAAGKSATAAGKTKAAKTNFGNGPRKFDLSKF